MEDIVSEGSLGKYLEFKLFEQFRDRLLPIIRKYSRDDSKKEDIYSHLFLSPANLSKERSFQVQGALSPFVCFWRTTPLTWNTENGWYGRSVLPRMFEYYNEKNEYHYTHGFLYDLKFSINLHSSSYYKDFRDRVNIDCIDIDRLRYFQTNVGELLPNCNTCMSKFELKMGVPTIADNPVSTAQSTRSFEMDVPFDVQITVPYTRTGIFYDKFVLYLNNNKIYEKEFT